MLESHITRTLTENPSPETKRVRIRMLALRFPFSRSFLLIVRNSLFNGALSRTILSRVTSGFWSSIVSHDTSITFPLQYYINLIINQSTASQGRALGDFYFLIRFGIRV